MSIGAGRYNVVGNDEAHAADWSQRTLYAGVDPGANGGIAIIPGLVIERDEAREPIFQHLNRDKNTEREIADFLKTWQKRIAGLVLEQSRPNRTHGVGQSSSTWFMQGLNYGFLRGILAALEIPFVDVAQNKWQKTFGLKRGSPDESATITKNRNKQKAEQLWPGVKLTHWKADALLLATYCRMKHAELF